MGTPALVAAFHVWVSALVLFSDCAVRVAGATSRLQASVVGGRSPGTPTCLARACLSVRVYRIPLTPPSNDGRSRVL